MLEFLNLVFQSATDIFRPEMFLAIGGFLFNLIALPTLLNPDAGIPRIQSVLSAAALLFFFTIPYLWMGFYFPALANTIGAIVWTTIAVYRTPNTTPNNTSPSLQNEQPAD